MDEEAISSVDLGIYWDRLISISDEVFNTLVRTAFSVIVREGRDACAVIMDESARSVAQSSQSLPAFLGTVPITTRYMLEKLPKNELRPGDILATNDPWLGPGQLNDITIVRPIFSGEKIVCFIGTVSHLPDIGGVGYSATSREIYHEGLNIPICKLREGEKFNQLAFDFIRSNVRMQDQVVGDVKAAISAGQTCQKRVEGLVEDLGVKKFLGLQKMIVERSESLVRAKISEIEEGIYEDEVHLEANREPITVHCSIRVRDKRIKVDFSGTSSSTDEAINSPITFTAAWTAYGIKCAISPRIPNNEGSFSPVEVTAPPGCIVNALRPCAVTARHMVGHLLPQIVFGALSSRMANKIMADSGGFSIMYFKGKDPRDQEFAIEYNTNGGLGANSVSDGAATRGFPTLAPNVPIEVWEATTGFRFVSKRLKPDSGGAGKFQGGQGQVVEIKNVTERPVFISVTINKTNFPPRGFLGGKNGSTKCAFINGTAIHPRGDSILNPGDVIRLEDSGGGGFYPPFERDLDSIKRDLQNGLITRSFVDRNYPNFAES